jgi:N-acetylmuramoyl-L-alanine amidase
MAKKVFIAPGHGGGDPGAVANGLKEKNLNLTISLACRDELERHGVLVKMSRETDVGESLSDQTSESNAFAPDLSVNIHNNAGGGDGAEVFYSIKSINGGTDKTLAVNILDEIKKIGQNSRGAKTRKNDKGTDWYGFIRDTKAPAVIVECAFLDHKTDVQIVDTVAEQKAMGVAIAKGCLKTLGIAYKEPGSAEPEKPAEPEVTGTEAPAHYDTAKAGTYKVTPAEGLYFRTGPNTKYASLALLAPGTIVKCLGHYTGEWLRVETADSKVGFCHSDFLEKVE